MSKEIFDYLAQVADTHDHNHILEVIGEFIWDRDLQDDFKIYLETQLVEPQPHS